MKPEELQQLKLVFTYMDNMAIDFGKLVKGVFTACYPHYDPTSTILRVLKLLWISPFCQGGWSKLGKGIHSSWIFYLIPTQPSSLVYPLTGPHNSLASPNSAVPTDGNINYDDLATKLTPAGKKSKDSTVKDTKAKASNPVRRPLK